MAVAASSRPTAASARTLDEPCGMTRLTQWRVDHVARTIERQQVRTFTDPFCEPGPAPNGASNAQALFLDENKSVLWKRDILLPKILVFDESKDGRTLDGGARKLRQATIQIKIAVNETTRRVRWLQIVAHDGTKWTPVAW